MDGNWFIALEVPTQGWWARVGEPPPGVKRFPAEDVHCTVAFLGPVGERAAEAAFALAPQWPTGAIEVTLGDVVPMGNLRRPSALSALVAGGREELAAAMSAVRAEMWRAAGARPDDRAPLPHVTTARPRRSARPDEIRAAIAWARRLDLGRPLVRLSRLALYARSEDRERRLFREHAVHVLEPRG